jgi:membrane fusion protein, multidrug efflux system
LLDSKAAYETAVKQYQVQKDELALANSRKGISNAQIEKALALIKTREAGVDNAKLKLSYTKIYAPVSGRVGKVNLQKGQYVQPGQPLFSIVNNEEFWIIANYKETQLKNLKAGQPVKIKIDGYPNLDIRGKISSFSDATGAKFSLLPPDNATGNFIKITQRVPVKITFDHPEKIKGILKAGLSVTVSAFIEK